MLYQCVPAVPVRTSLYTGTVKYRMGRYCIFNLKKKRENKLKITDTGTLRTVSVRPCTCRFRESLSHYVEFDNLQPF